MKQDKNNLQKNEQNSVTERRQFIKKFGKLAGVTPIAVTTLMSTYSSKAIASTGNDDGGVI